MIYPIIEPASNPDFEGGFGVVVVGGKVVLVVLGVVPLSFSYVHL